MESSYTVRIGPLMYSRTVFILAFILVNSDRYYLLGIYLSSHSTNSVHYTFYGQHTAALNMDHLPIPSVACPLTLEIPLLCSPTTTLSLNEESFRTFPTSCAFDDALDRDWKALKGSGKYMLEFYQRWLYFGLMAAFFNKPISVKDFSRCSDTSGIMVVDCRKLNPLIDEWWLRTLRTLRILLSGSAPQCLQIAMHHCLYLDQPHVIEAWQDEPGIEILLSIKVLMASLLSALKLPKSDDMISQLKPWSKKLGREPPSATILTAHMIRNGWCPLRIRHILPRFSYNTLFYLAETKPRGSRQAKHDTCLDKGSCEIDTTVQDCRCQHICRQSVPCLPQSPPMEKVNEIIKNNGVPLVTCVRDGRGGFNLDVIEAGPYVRYTAINHVWADGLGK